MMPTAHDIMHMPDFKFIFCVSVQEVATPRISLFMSVVELNNLLSLGSVPSQLRASLSGVSQLNESAGDEEDE